MKPNNKSICFYFQIHQPIRLRLYRFFDIGKDSHYYDDFANRTILKKIVQKCYLPMNELLLKEIKKHKGNFKVAFSISGSALEQFSRYAPEVLDSFKQLADTGCVEFLCETYYHSLSSIKNENEFKHQILKHKKAIKEYFGIEPTAFRNTALIYSNEIGRQVYELGFNTILTEGAKHILGWKNPNFIYTNPYQPKQNILLRNYSLSDDITFRFSSTPNLTAELYLDWLKKSANEGEIINLFMDYETFGEYQNANSGIFEFMEALPDFILNDKTFRFVTPSEASKKHKGVADLDVNEIISWVGEERGITDWLGNELQQDAFNKLYSLYEKLSILNNPTLWNDFGHLQESDHFYYMCRNFFTDNGIHKYFNPYDSPYEAFINYMNVLSDFIIRINDEISISNANFVNEN